jgi:hypothetical protein
MSRSEKRIGGWGFGLAVAGALAFGGLVAVAKPANATSCPDDGWTWLGEQPSDGDCYYACYAVHGQNLDHYRWNQTTHCCTCFF